MSIEHLPANLRRIRAARRLTQTAAAAAAGLSRSAYRKIEEGGVQPRGRTLEAIAAALRVQPRDLVEAAPTLKSVRFRSRTALKSRSQIVAEAGRRLADYNQLEALVGAQRPYRLSTIAASARTGSVRPESVARAARAALELSPREAIRNICGLLDSAGIKVFAIPVATQSFFGMSIGRMDGGPAIVVNTWDRVSVERWIFTAAHELGHLLLHHDDYDVRATAEDPSHEHEADAFASEFLMPDEVFQQEWRDTSGLPLVERVVKLKRMFHVGYRTILARLATTPAEWRSVWKRFHEHYRRNHGSGSSIDSGKLLSTETGFRELAPAALRGNEPDQLSASDFREDRLAGLVRKAVEQGDISLPRGAEILGLTLRDMRSISSSWYG